MLIHSKRIYTSEGVIDGILRIEDGKFKEIIKNDNNLKIDIDYGNKRIIPGIIDTHNHGTMGYSLLGGAKDGPKNIRGYLKGLASQGVTACLPTAALECFKDIVEVVKEGHIDGALPLGIHSEGPWLNRVGEKGIDYGHPEITMEYAKKMVHEAQGMLKLVAIAPELDGAYEVIKYFNSLGIRCAFAHSNMMYDEAMDAFNHGISVITHTANVMSGIHHRHMGGLGAALLNDDVYNELICDGLHVSNEMIEIMFRVKHNYLDKFMMISDNIPLAGAPFGRYKINDTIALNIDEKGYCLTDEGRLCGSGVPVIYGIRNLCENMHMDLSDVIKMSSLNPSKVYNALNKGSIEIGKDADFVVINDDYKPLYTYREGNIIYDYLKDVDIFNNNFLNDLRK